VAIKFRPSFPIRAAPPTGTGATDETCARGMAPGSLAVVPTILLS
jgi:hypothetical protein